MQLLSRITTDWTVGFLRAKKQSGSTHRGLHVGIGFGSFYKIHEVGVLSYLIYLLFKCFVDG